MKKQKTTAEYVNGIVIITSSPDDYMVEILEDDDYNLMGEFGDFEPVSVSSSERYYRDKEERFLD
jgi:hypothetical protein